MSICHSVGCFSMTIITTFSYSYSMSSLSNFSYSYNQLMKTILGLLKGF